LRNVLRVTDFISHPPKVSWSISKVYAHDFASSSSPTRGSAGGY